MCARLCEFISRSEVNIKLEVHRLGIGVHSCSGDSLKARNLSFSCFQCKREDFTHIDLGEFVDHPSAIIAIIGISIIAGLQEGIEFKSILRSDSNLREVIL